MPIARSQTSFPSLILSLMLAIVSRCNTSNAHAPKRPNVVLMMADDLAYADLSCYGSTAMNTPVLDKLASQGVRLKSCYAGCTVCTPSRMALLTGAYPVRAGWQGGVVGYGIKPQNGLAPEAVTIAEVFKKAGYRTGLIGKWHLGDAKALSPMRQGFDTAFYIDKSNNQTKKLWRGKELVADPFDNRRLTEQFTNEAVRFIDRNKAQPFFLYVPFSAPHFPAQAHPEWQGKSQNAAYGDVVEELDSRVGEILSALSNHHLEEQTIVVFLSDNGVEPGQKKWARSTPYRGLKWSALEGGNRVPCIIRWPGEIAASQVSDAIVGAIDLMPTLADACGIVLPKDTLPHIDGVNVLETLKGMADRPHPRTSLLFWNGWGTPQAIRVGDWKLYLDQVKEIPATQHGPVLIKLSVDPEERNDLGKQYPRRVQSMKAEAKRQLLSIKASRMGLAGPPDSKARVPSPAKWLD